MRGRILPLLLAVLLAGCAGWLRRGGADPEQRLERGLAALEAEQFSEAHADLSWVYTSYADQKLGRRALLALAALELDPRNPERRLAIGAELAGRYLRMSDIPRWTEPAAEALYLLALELGGTERQKGEAEAAAARAQARARRLQAQAAPQRDLPRLPGPPVTARIRALQQERSELSGRVAELGRRVTELERELEARNEELARIRKTLRP